MVSKVPEGKKNLTSEQLTRIEPMVWAQKCKEITIKSIVEEMSDFWSNGWGWYPPLHHTLQLLKGDWTFKLALLKIRKNIQTEGFLEFILSYSGFNKVERDRYVRRFLSKI